MVAALIFLGIPSRPLPFANSALIDRLPSRQVPSIEALPARAIIDSDFLFGLIRAIVQPTVEHSNLKGALFHGMDHASA